MTRKYAQKVYYSNAKTNNINININKRRFNSLLHEDKVFQHNVDDEVQYDVTVACQEKKKIRIKNFLIA